VSAIASIVELIPGDLAGLIAVTAGLAVFALLLALDERRKRSLGRPADAKPAGPLEQGRDWQTLVGIVEDELAHAPRVSELHASAALQLDAAEHAFNTVLRTCAPYFQPAVSPTVEPMRELVHTAPPAPAPAAQPAQPLAA
jgi:hypothetical protein